jgi:hypothetical protein
MIEDNDASQKKMKEISKGGYSLTVIKRYKERFVVLSEHGIAYLPTGVAD